MDDQITAVACEHQRARGDATLRHLDGEAAARLAAIFGALSDPTRLRIISALAQREFCVTELAAALSISQSAISHQLSDMRDLHLVCARREGRHIYYRLEDEHVHDLFLQGLAHIEHYEASNE
jgi:ArsR family transcriptional regulator, lead/cadmium/zinc/bismuth-responsive transcriptional repressor